MSSASGSTGTVTNDLTIHGNVFIDGEIHYPVPPPIIPPKGGGTIPVEPPVPPTPDNPPLPPVPYQNPIESLGGFVGPYFQAMHTTISNAWGPGQVGEAAPVMGPFWTPGMITFTVTQRRTDAAGSVNNGQMMSNGTISLTFAPGVSTYTVGVSDANFAYLPSGVVGIDNQVITDAHPIPVGTVQLYAEILFVRNDLHMNFQNNLTTDTRSVPMFMVLHRDNVDMSSGCDFAWTFVPSPGYPEQVVPMNPIPASYTYHAQDATPGPLTPNLPPAWTAGQSYAPGYVVTAPTQPPVAGSYRYYVATSQVGVPSVNQPGTQKALFPAVEWTLFGA